VTEWRHKFACNVGHGEQVLGGTHADHTRLSGWGERVLDGPQEGGT